MTLRYSIPLATLLLFLCGELQVLRADATDVVVNEILYHPDPDNTGGEFVELLNRGDTAVDLSGWAFAEAIIFQFPAGTVLESGAYLVVARSVEDARAAYGIDDIVGPFDGRLNNAGETLVLQDGSQQEIDSVPYDDGAPWPAEADGGGPSLELVDPTSDNSRRENWAIGQPYSPGAPNAPTEAGGGDIVITEIMYKPLRQEPREKFDRVNQGPYIETGDDEFGEYVEIYNRTDEVVDLSGWSFTEGIEFEFAEGEKLAPGAYLAVAGAPDMLKARQGITNVLGPFSLSLRDGGERITLRDRDLQLVETVRYDDEYPWPTAPDEAGVSLECIAPFEDNSTAANWRSSDEEFPPPQPILDEEEGDTGGWQLLSATATATRTLVLGIFVDGSGEWLIDEVELRPIDGGDNLVPNGSFDEGDDGWEKRGNHEGSFWTNEEAREGAGAEHLVSTGKGSISNSFRLRLSGMQEGTQYRLTAWAKFVKGHPTLSTRGVGAPDLSTSVGRLTFDLSEDWSDTANPNGAWDCRDADGELIAGQTQNWLEADLGAGQPAWANGDGEVPGWCKSSGNAPTLDFPSGWAGTHGPSEVRWTSGGLGEVTISGGLYLPRHADRNQIWAIKRNDTTLTSGELISGRTEFNSGNPLSLESGTGGPDALTAPVSEGDVIRLVIGDPGRDGDFVAVSIGIKFRRGRLPEPPLAGAIGRATPGRQNSAAADGLPPFVENLQHFPVQPTSTDAVSVTAEVTSATALKSVELGLEFLLGTSRETMEPLLEMFDDGAHNDGEANDDIYGAQVSARESQTLVHYWVCAEDIDGRVTVFPYDDEPSTAQSYFHYDAEIDTQMTTYHLFMSAENLRHLSRDPRTDEYLDASIVIDDRREGKEEGPIAYGHIGARHRGRASRSNSQHQWKFKFNRIQLYDQNRTLDTMLSIPLTQKMGFAVFDLAGIENLESDLVRLHLNGRFWSYYITFESPNSTWAAKHNYGAATEAYKARSSETPGKAKNSDLFRNELLTDWDFWGAWNKKMRSLEPPVHIRELTDVLVDFPDEELLPWFDENLDVEQLLTHWGIKILLNIDDLHRHNYYLFRPEDGKWKMLGYDFDSLGRLIWGNLRYTYGDENNLFLRILQNKTTARIRALNMRRMLDTFFTEAILFPLVDAEAARADRRAQGNSLAHVKTQIRTQRRNMLSAIARLRLPGKDEVPKIDPPGGVSAEALSVTLSTPEGWRAVYTVDGSDPRLSTTATLYSDPIPIVKTTTVRAASIAAGEPPPDFGAGEWTDLSEERYEFGSSDTPLFVRGDFSLDRRVTTTDVVQLLLHLFKGGPAPCEIAGDANNDNALNITDAIVLVDYLFRRGAEPAAPFPQPGVDPDGAERLGCERGVSLDE